MRIIKIGRSSVNDIVLSDLTVSSSHAIIEIQDDGQVFIKDLNSKNGTFVNEVLIKSRTSIFANDLVRVGTSKLDWLSYLNKMDRPRPVNADSRHSSVIHDLDSKVTIGRSASNDIVFSEKDVSSAHAYLAKKKDGSLIIVDLDSSNGTFVNGKRVSVHTLQKGDQVLLANKYTLNWSKTFESTKSYRWVKVPAVFVLLVSIILGGWLYYSNRSWPAEKIYSTYGKSTVMIIASYYYKVTVGEHDFGMWIVEGGQCKRITEKSEAMFGTGTGFFISDDGKMITNKHVVNFWEYSKQDTDIIIATVQSLLKELVINGKLSQIEYLPLVNEVHVKPELSFLGVLPNDTYLTSISDAILCSIVKTSANEIDLAIIQTNSKSLPVGVSHFIEIGKADISEVKVGTRIFSIGFPEGLNIGKTNVGIEANNQSGEITQIRGDIEFGHNVAIRGGSSGSPVFNNMGELIGVMNAGFVHTQGYNMAIKSKSVMDFVNQ